MDKTKLFWATDSELGTHGNMYGYYVQTTMLKEYIQRRTDIELTTLEEAKNILYITTPEIFDVNFPGKNVFLLTMFEGLDIPKIYIQNIQKADYLITPSHWVRDLFTPYFDKDKIFVVPLGVESIFTYKKRKLHPKHFRYLWVGAPNPRKGFVELVVLWQKLGLDKDPSIELYIKTTKIPNVEVQQMRNVILDSRNLSKSDLVGLYHSAHCFVLPTRGEGFGLTLAEAMATGLPCIATNFSGLTEFFDDKVGYPVDYEFEESEMLSPRYGSLGDTRASFPKIREVAEKMLEVRFDYKRALQKGVAASIRIKRGFTWENSAEKLASVIRGQDGGDNGIMH